MSGVALAAVAAASAVACAVGGAGRVDRQRLLAGAAVGRRDGRGVTPRGSGRVAVQVVAAAAVPVAALLLAVPVLPVAAVALAALVALRLREAARRQRDAAEVRRRVVDACESVVGELRAGRPPSEALAGAVRAWPALGPVSATSRLGGDVPRELRELARTPGAAGLRLVAGAWQLCATSGTGLAHALEQVLLTVRADQAAARRVGTELAASRATARMVAALPLLLLLVAQGAGARPAHLLLTTTGGQLCLLVGVALAGAGLLWIERLAATAVESR